MNFSLGLDTGGTYTDAVLFNDATQTVIAKAKALTTRHDLAIGIAAAADQVISNAKIDVNAIDLFSVSTTLATNALVEGQGEKAALIMIGFTDKDLDRAGLRQALGNDPVIFLEGGHDVHGKPKPLDLEPLRQALESLSEKVTAFAVAGAFSVRNPAHELAARALITTMLDCPVTCSHELSSKLDGPRRALTCLLNARLVGMIARLIDASQSFLDGRNINAPLMVVRGDGSLIPASMARQRPIETILSGPAASLVGAHFLTGADDGFVSDIGGTTTDIALLQEGRPRIDPAGASVGGFRTMVEAVAMRTYGLGGDSEVHLREGGLEAHLNLGPRRLVPISLLGTIAPDVVISALEKQLKKPFPDRTDGRFALATGVPERLKAGLSKSEAALMSRLSYVPQPLGSVLQGTAEVATLDRLVARGLAQIGGFTPSDAQHVLGAFDHWNRQAAELAAAVFIRKRDGYGKPIAASAEALSQMVVDRLIRLSAERVLETALEEDGLEGEKTVRSALVQKALDRADGYIRPNLGFHLPIIGLGAGAQAYYPKAAALLGTQGLVPDDADVANAIGAVVGQIRVTAEIEVVVLENGMFALTGADMATDKAKAIADEGTALDMAREQVKRLVGDKVLAAGAVDAKVELREDIKAVKLDDQRKFISASFLAIATGRPSTARVH